MLTNDLTTTLREIGMAEVLLKRRGQWAVDCDKLDCDYYRMRDGDAEAINAYRGQYMAQYSWAELTSAQLQFRNEK